MRDSRVRFGLLIAIVAALCVADIAGERFSDYMAQHQVLAGLLTEVLLLAAAYLVLDEVIQHRQARRWADVMRLGIDGLASRVEEVWHAVERPINEFAWDSGQQAPGMPVRTTADETMYLSSSGHEEFVRAYANAFGDWLRSDRDRARRFAATARQSATELDQALMQLAPTLADNPDSAGLTNRLPAMSSAARSAADAVAPTARFFDREQQAYVTRELSVAGWGADDRHTFETSLLEILQRRDEFIESKPARTSR